MVIPMYMIKVVSALVCVLAGAGSEMRVTDKLWGGI
jgi:hypothetical protein